MGPPTTKHIRGSTSLRGEALRFLLVGGANTTVTTLAFYLLAVVLPAWAAFTVVYVGGLAFVVAVTPRYVFGREASATRRLLLALWYVATYLVGLGVVGVLDSTLAAPRLVVVLGTVAVTAPLSFAGARLLLSRRQVYAPASSGRGSTPSG